MKYIVYINIIVLWLLPLSNSYADTANRIVSLGPGVTEALCLLNASDKIIANTLYCKTIPEKSITKIGTIVNMDIEKIISLNPDLVIGIGLSNKKQLKKLENLNIPTATFLYPKSYEELCNNLIRLGKLIGKETRAKQVVSESNQQVDTIKKAIAELSPKTVFVQIGAKPLFAAIENSFINDIIVFAGGENIVKKQKTGLYSREKVLSQNPDIIIITTMGIVGKKEKEIWETYDTLKAVKTNSIYVLDSYELCSPTVETFPKILKKIAQILQPEAYIPSENNR